MKPRVTVCVSVCQEIQPFTLQAELVIFLLLPPASLNMCWGKVCNNNSYEL